MTDLNSRNSYESSTKKRNFSIESILQSDELQQSLRTPPEGAPTKWNVKLSSHHSNLRNGELQSSHNRNRSEDKNDGSFETISIKDNFSRKASSSEVTIDNQCIQPPAPPHLPLTIAPVDSSHLEHFDWLSCTRYNPPRLPSKFLLE